MQPLTQTAYLCCGARAADARSAAPLCGDHLAERFMDANGRAIYARFKGLRAQNSGIVARHRIIDDLLKARLRATPDLCVILLGAGFDTRAFRFDGGHWIELDAPALMERKEKILPSADCPNPLTRVAIDFSVDDLGAKLSPWKGKPSIVVMEGVSMYLEEADWQSTLHALKAALPGHALICDLMTRHFAGFYSRASQRRVAQLGVEFASLADDPTRIIRSAGYRCIGEESVAAFAFGRGTKWVPKGVPPRWLMNTFLRSLRDGYRIVAFEAPQTITGAR